MRRGDIYLVDFTPARGSEAGKRRPAVVVSHDALNEAVHELRQGVITVVPFTTNVERVLSFQVLLPAEVTGLEHDSKAQAEQVRAVALERFAPGPIGTTIPSGYMRRIDAALRLHLDLD
jgi:mRNA interferase MazF